MLVGIYIHHKLYYKSYDHISSTSLVGEVVWSRPLHKVRVLELELELITEGQAVGEGSAEGGPM